MLNEARGETHLCLMMMDGLLVFFVRMALFDWNVVGREKDETVAKNPPALAVKMRKESFILMGFYLLLMSLF